MINRSLESLAFSDAYGRQMRFVLGPRQTGKTTMARNFLKLKGYKDLYYNWDSREIKNRFRADPSFFMPDVLNAKKENGKVWLCFDEIHKVPKWKNILKGIFDDHEAIIQFIITGSARLDLLKYTGESLLGRYFSFRLFPLSLAELNTSANKIEVTTSAVDAKKFIEQVLSNTSADNNAFEQLLLRSGFPEPFLSDSDRFLNKWHDDYIEHYIKEDLRDLTSIHDLENVFNMVHILPSRVGSPLSLNSIREDLDTSHTAVRGWLRALQLIYVVFTVKPYTKKIARGLKKAEKCYFFDWTRVKDEGSRFENYVAVELSSFCSFLTSSGVGNYELFYLKTKDNLETDFLVVREGKPWILFECKSSDSAIETHHIGNATKLGNIPLVQLTRKSGVLSVRERKYFTISADRFFYNLAVSPK